MVLSAQAQRNWRVAAIVCSTFAGVYSVFFADYNLNGEPHIFSSIQENRGKIMDQIVYGARSDDNDRGVKNSKDESGAKQSKR
jgi:hypothetical protein